MPECQSDGVRFHYPEEWDMTREERGRDVMFHLQSDGTAFVSLFLIESRPTAQEARTAIVDAYRSEYPDLDYYDGPELMTDGPVASCELSFVFLDFVSSASVRAEATMGPTFVAVCQAEDREFEERESEFATILSSIRYLGDAPKHSCGHDHSQGHDHDHSAG